MNIFGALLCFLGLHRWLHDSSTRRHCARCPVRQILRRSSDEFGNRTDYWDDVQ